MRIFYLSSEAVPGNSGGSVHTLEVARHLAEQGCQITLLCHRLKGQLLKEKIDGIEVIRKNLSLLNRRISILSFIKLFSIDLAKYDLLIERYSWLSGAGIYHARRKKITSILEVNSPVLDEVIWRFGWKENFIRTILLKRLSNFQMREANGIITTISKIIPDSYHHKSLFSEWGVNTDIFTPDNKAKKECLEFRNKFFLKDDFVVVFSGSFYPWHGVSDLKEIIKNCKENKKIKFLLIGSGGKQPEVVEDIKKNVLAEQVVFQNQVSYEKIPFLIAAADLGIAPYNIEHYPPLKKFGFFWSPLKIFEYLACGIPVLTSKYGRLEELLRPGNCAVFSEPGNSLIFSNHIKDLARHRDRLKDMGIAARKLAEEKYSWDNHTRKLMDFFKKITKGPRP